MSSTPQKVCPPTDNKMSSVQAEPMIILETADAGELCPHCDSLKKTVVFKVWLGGGDTYICEDCFDKMEKEEEEEEEEWCEKHNQVMRKCDDCPEEEEDEDESS